jgi:hypothetical protein
MSPVANILWKFIYFFCFHFKFYDFLKCFDRAEPVYFEFPEFKANLRRDYWLDISLEILRAHMFVRKFGLKDTQKSEVLARASLGIFRYRALKEAFKFFSSNYKTLLTFNLAETLPRGDIILKTLSNTLMNLTSVSGKRRIPANVESKKKLTVSPAAAVALFSLGFKSKTATGIYEETTVVCDIRVGEINPLEVAIKKSLMDTGKAQAAQATVDQVKVEGIDTNVAVMKVCYYLLSVMFFYSEKKYLNFI